MKTLTILITVTILMIGCDHDYACPASLAIAVIGEAANQPIEGQIAVVCGIRNRPEGLRGVYGTRMKRVPSRPEVQKAHQAITQATPKLCYELIRGADMWENVDAFGYPKDWPAVLFIRKIGDHVFYRRIVSRKE